MTFIGTAGWAIAKAMAAELGGDGSHLARYARRFDAVEINSSFYRPHERETYVRWAATVPEHFRFAVKVPRELTHERRLRDVTAPLERFLGECTGLGEKLGPLLVQLPPSLAFRNDVAAAFFRALRDRFDGAVVAEPRHATWFAPDAETLLDELRVARVAADPPPVPAARHPGAWSGLRYLRWHGSPTMYYSTYDDAALASLARTAGEGDDTWIIFDNTAAGAAMPNALALQRLLLRQPFYPDPTGTDPACAP